MGAVHEAAPALEAVRDSAAAELVGVVTTPESASGRLSGAVDLPGLVDPSVPVLRTEDINAPEHVAWIRGLQPRLLVVVGWTRLIRDELLAVPTYGCVGFHASLLPLHRGRAPVNWSLILGEAETGNTMMLLSPGADTGDIVDQRRTPIYLDDTCATVYERVGALGADMLSDHLPALLSGTAPRTPQDVTAGDLMPKRVPAMGVIDWARPPVEVHNWVRAQTAPYPGAFTELDGRKVMVWATAPPLRSEAAGVSGEVLAVEDGIRVGAGGGSVLVTSASWEGESPAPAAAWARETGIGPGTRFTGPDPAVAAWARGEGPRPVAVP